MSRSRYADRPYGLPPHGTRARYRQVGCRCVGCTRSPYGIDLPDRLLWPFRFLERRVGEQLKMWFDDEQIERWRINGLGDYEADEVCIKIGLLPHEVFPGYMEAGLDCDSYP